MPSRNKRRRHGQHMLVSAEVADRLVDCAKISPKDTILEIGTGTGMVTTRLCERAGKVISYEIDRHLYEEARNSFLKGTNNLELRLGDAFRGDSVPFDICVTSLPYSESLRFVKWLALLSGEFKRCVAVIQSEFAEKLTSSPGKDSYRAVSVIAQCSFEIRRLFFIEKEKFHPPPRVLSEAIMLSPNSLFEQPFFDPDKISLINKLFSFRGRLVSVATKKLDLELSDGLSAARLEHLSPNEFAGIITTVESRKAS